MLLSGTQVWMRLHIDPRARDHTLLHIVLQMYNVEGLAPWQHSQEAQGQSRMGEGGQSLVLMQQVTLLVG